MADNTPNPQRTNIRHEACEASSAGDLAPLLGKQLTADFGRGFDERNLRHMRAFFQTFPIWNAVRSELSWAHYRLLKNADPLRRVAQDNKDATP